MTIAIRHSKVVTIPDDGTSPVGTDEWNADHVLTGNLPVANLNSGVDASPFTFWRGDGAWGNSLVGSGAVSSTASVPRMFSVIDGTTGAGAIATQRTPTVLISRIEGIADNGTSDGSDGPGLYSVLTTQGTQQGVAISALAFANAASAADVVGLYGSSSQNGAAGTHSAFGGFFIAAANTAGSGAIAIELETSNSTSTDKAYNPATQLGGTPFMVGIDNNYTSSTNKLGQAGILVRSSGGNGVGSGNKWDVGLAFLNGVNSADIRTDTTSATILLAGATAHTNGIDLSASTISGSAFKSSGFSVNGSGAIAGASLTTAGTAAIGGALVAGRTLVLTTQAAAQPTFAFNMAGVAAGKAMIGLLYDGQSALSAPGIVIQTLDDTGGFVSNNSTIWRDGTFTIGSITKYAGAQIALEADRPLRFNNQTSAAAAAAGTLTNAPVAGNPGHWLKINIGGTNYAIPCWLG